MFCSNCGKQITDGTKVCPHCGAAVNNQPVSENPLRNPEVQQASASEPMKSGQTAKKTGLPKKPLIIIAVAVALFLGFGAIVSMFDGNESEPSFSPVLDIFDLLGKIPEIATETNMLSMYSSIGSGLIPAIQYTDIPSDDIATFGLPNDSAIEYYGNGSVYLGFRDKSATYVGMDMPDSLAGVPVKSHTEIAAYEPLIARTAKGTYLFLYRALGEQAYRCEQAYRYVVYVMDTPADPSASYLNWIPLYRIEVSDISDCTFLNGTQKLEIVSIPGMSVPDNSGSGDRSTQTTDIAPPEEWLDKIPIVTNLHPYDEFGQTWTGFPKWNKQLKFLLFSTVSQKLENIMLTGDEKSYWGLTNENVEYYLSGTYFGTHIEEIGNYQYELGWFFGVYNDELVYRVSDTDGMNGSVSAENYDFIKEREPLIIRSDTTYLLCYKIENEKETAYVLYMVEPDDPTVSYLKWIPLYTITATSAEICDYLNGRIPVEVISIPGKR